MERRNFLKGAIGALSLAAVTGKATIEAVAASDVSAALPPPSGVAGGLTGSLQQVIGNGAYELTPTAYDAPTKWEVFKPLFDGPKAGSKVFDGRGRLLGMLIDDMKDGKCQVSIDLGAMHPMPLKQLPRGWWSHSIDPQARFVNSWGRPDVPQYTYLTPPQLQRVIDEQKNQKFLHELQLELKSGAGWEPVTLTGGEVVCNAGRLPYEDLTKFVSDQGDSADSVSYAMRTAMEITRARENGGFVSMPKQMGKSAVYDAVRRLDMQEPRSTGGYGVAAVGFLADAGLPPQSWRNEWGTWGKTFRKKAAAEERLEIMGFVDLAAPEKKDFTEFFAYQTTGGVIGNQRAIRPEEFRQQYLNEPWLSEDASFIKDQQRIRGKAADKVVVDDYMVTPLDPIDVKTPGGGSCRMHGIMLQPVDPNAPTTPIDMLKTAETLADQIISLPLADRQYHLASLQSRNEVLHSLVKAKLRQLNERVFFDSKLGEPFLVPVDKVATQAKLKQAIKDHKIANGTRPNQVRMSPEMLDAVTKWSNIAGRTRDERRAAARVFLATQYGLDLLVDAAFNDAFHVSHVSKTTITAISQLQQRLLEFQVFDCRPNKIVMRPWFSAQLLAEICKLTSALPDKPPTVESYLQTVFGIPEIVVTDDDVEVVLDEFYLSHTSDLTEEDWESPAPPVKRTEVSVDELANQVLYRVTNLLKAQHKFFVLHGVNPHSLEVKVDSSLRRVLINMAGSITGNWTSLAAAETDDEVLAYEFEQAFGINLHFVKDGSLDSRFVRFIG